jgi:catechol 2,3-dioxygenase
VYADKGDRCQVKLARAAGAIIPPKARAPAPVIPKGPQKGHAGGQNGIPSRASGTEVGADSAVDGRTFGTTMLCIRLHFLRTLFCMSIDQTPVAPPLVCGATSHIAFRTPDVAALVRFYVDVVGLEVQDQPTGDGARLGLGRGHHVLDLIPGEAGLDHIGFEIRERGALDIIAGVLAERGTPTRRLNSALTGADGIEVTDPEGNRLQLHGHVDRSGEGRGIAGHRPIRFQHITLATAAMDEMVAFYTEQLGFRISDRMGDAFTWLRSNHDHHTLAIVQVGHGGDIDHYSYDVAGWDDFKAWCDRLADQGVPVTWGPGRHGPGNNLFIMFDDPDGRHIELSAEMERFWDDRASYEPRDWRTCPETVNLWGGLVPSWRHADRVV